ncbi:hypothetical protein XPN_2065 [Xanthomonas arboricola pv. pruni MAFF 301427]|nr:hypothetical protein XPN_2065 [Xanthomonas arboricola pv. pruni MAFF 301427]
MSKTEHGVTAMGVMALELTGGTAPERGALAPEQAGMLAERIGRDLAQWIPEVRELELSVAMAHFDPAEVLRPGWPLHRRLDELHARAPGAIRARVCWRSAPMRRARFRCPSRPTHS